MAAADRTDTTRRPGAPGFALAAVAVAVATTVLTQPRIEYQATRAQAAVLAVLLAGVPFDNDPVADRVMVSSPALLGRPDPLAVYRARQGATVTAAVVTVVAPQAYLGPVELLVAVRRDGRVLGLHVVSHRETAGLGDQIEPARSPWSLQFTDRSLAAPPAAGWAVRTDGGEFDQITGATVTSRAVVNAVRNALLLVAEREADIFGATVATGARSP